MKGWNTFYTVNSPVARSPLLSQMCISHQLMMNLGSMEHVSQKGKLALFVFMFTRNIFLAVASQGGKIIKGMPVPKILFFLGWLTSILNTSVNFFV